MKISYPYERSFVLSFNLRSYGHTYCDLKFPVEINTPRDRVLYENATIEDLERAFKEFLLNRYDLDEKKLEINFQSILTRDKEFAGDQRVCFLDPGMRLTLLDPVLSLNPYIRFDRYAPSFFESNRQFVEAFSCEFTLGKHIVHKDKEQYRELIELLNEKTLKRLGESEVKDCCDRIEREPIAPGDSEEPGLAIPTETRVKPEQGGAGGAAGGGGAGFFKPDTSKLEEIPKIIHFIWFGGPLPDKYSRNIKKFLEKNPSYTIKLWRNWLSDGETLETPLSFLESPEIVISDPGKLSCEDIIVQCGLDIVKRLHRRCPVMASDLLRFILLYLEGGIYLDTDVCCLKELPTEPLKYRGKQVVNLEGKINNAMLASLPQTLDAINIIKELIKSIIEYMYGKLEGWDCFKLLSHESDINRTLRLILIVNLTGPSKVREIPHEKDARISACLSHKFDASWLDEIPTHGVH